jgi:hypothetical protein
MTPQERDLILNVFDRLAKLAGGTKDREAEALIAERMRAIPDSAYNLVEAVVVQDLAIKERDARINELEQRLSSAPPPQQQGGFAQGPAANPWGRGSVPSVPQQQAQQYAPPPQYAPQPQYAQPQSPWGGQPGGGGFLRTAAGAAVGVAGGMLLANSISSMFAGGHAGGSPFGGSASPASETITENITNNYYGSAPPAAPTADYQPQFDTNVADTSGYDPGYDGGGGFDDGGGDF